MKKKILCMAAAMMAVSAFSATPAFAAETSGDGSRTTDVTYDSRGIATEGDPDTAQWGIAVPSKIQFTDDNKNADVSVELVGYNGYTMEQLDKQVTTGDVDFNATVKVKSKNSLKLMTDDDSEGVKYQLVYGTNDALTSDNADIAAGVKIADLGIDKTDAKNFKGKSETGIATLLQTGKVQAAHTDTLTFSVSSNLTTPNPDRVVKP